MENKNRMLTSGQFAKMLHVNRRTLHYYDEIGLFSPVETGENGYRYYSRSQCMDFAMLRSLRELGVSLEELQSQSWNADTARELFAKKAEEIGETIRKMENARQMLWEKCGMLDTIKNADLDAVTVEERKEWRIKKSRSIFGKTDEQVSDILLEFSNEFPNAGLFNHSYGTAIRVEKLGRPLTGQYDFFYARLRDGDMAEPDLVIPAGKCLTAYFVGECIKEWEAPFPVYEKLLDYARQHGLRPTGYAFERGMNEMSIESMEDYVLQILVPCVED